MAQLTIYLDDAAERRVKVAARKSGVSVSRWIAELVESRTRTHWPPEARELAERGRIFLISVNFEP